MQVELLKNAVKQQIQISKLAVQGLGVDRHLYALQKVCCECFVFVRARVCVQALFSSLASLSIPAVTGSLMRGYDEGFDESCITAALQLALCML
jgi:hypothetical protein